MAVARRSDSPASGREHRGSLADNRIRWPSRKHVVRVLTLQSYNSRVVLLGTTLLGATAGVVGTFMLLRQRALIGDVIGHASLAGMAVAFLCHGSLFRARRGQVTSRGSYWRPGWPGCWGACVAAVASCADQGRRRAGARFGGVLRTWGLRCSPVVQHVADGQLGRVAGTLFIGKAASLNGPMCR